MTLKEKLKLIHTAEAAALLAGQCLNYQRDSWRSVHAATMHDVKIQADRESEKLIIESLADSTFPIFSEEAGLINTSKGNARKGIGSDYIWIIDPVDGSLNYHQGVPFSAVSIALYKGSCPIIGVVYDFNHAELFTGLVGIGAWLNQHDISPSVVDNISKAVLGTGFPVNRDFSMPALSNFIREIQQYRKIRLLGSAALSLCYVACGRIDGYREERIMFWDVAAGLAILKAAGGSMHVKDYQTPGSPVDVVASNGALKING